MGKKNGKRSKTMIILERLSRIQKLKENFGDTLSLLKRLRDNKIKLLFALLIL